MKTFVQAIGTAALLVGLLFASERPAVPDNLKAPAGEAVILVGHDNRPSLRWANMEAY